MLRDLVERARLDERKLRIEVVENFARGADGRKRIAVRANEIAEIGVAAVFVEFENDGGRRLIEIDQSGVGNDADDAAVRRFFGS